MNTQTENDNRKSNHRECIRVNSKGMRKWCLHKIDRCHPVDDGDITNRIEFLDANLINSRLTELPTRTKTGKKMGDKYQQSRDSQMPSTICVWFAVKSDKIAENEKENFNWASDVIVAWKWTMKDDIIIASTLIYFLSDECEIECSTCRRLNRNTLHVTEIMRS